MNEKYNCNVIRDLLPGYIDNILSDAGNELVNDPNIVNVIVYYAETIPFAKDKTNFSVVQPEGECRAPVTAKI